MSKKKLKKLVNKIGGKEVIFIIGFTALILIAYFGFRAGVGYMLDPYKDCRVIPTEKVNFVDVKGGETVSDIALRLLNENPEYTEYTLKDMEYTIVFMNQMDSGDCVKTGDVLAIPVPDKANEKEESTP